MRPTDVTLRLNRLADLCPSSDGNRRRVLENIDLIAQLALDAEQTYVNKRGEPVTFEAPQWSVVLNAQKLAANLLGLDTEPKDKDKPNAADSPVKRILAAVPAKAGT